jgi:hypothetical protein
MEVWGIGRKWKLFFGGVAWKSTRNVKEETGRNKRLESSREFNHLTLMICLIVELS